ncbi:MAG: hypothetical protein AAGI90_02130 [Chlamydiota bacterium]
MSQMFSLIGVFLLTIHFNMFAEPTPPTHATPYVRFNIERTKSNDILNNTNEEISEETVYFGAVDPEHYYHIVRVSNLFDVIYTHDESKWEVNKYDRWKIKTWSPEDTIIITQNTGCCHCYSHYPYRMINTYDGSEIEVDLKLGPAYDGKYTRWVAGLDIPKKFLILDNGSRWKVNYYDYNILKKWEANDTIIVGVNTDWCSATENILINVETGTFVRAGQE